MKKIKLLFLSLLCVSCGNVSTKIEASLPAEMKDGIISLSVPPRAEGQQSALLMTNEPMNEVRVGFIGLGMRGASAIHRYVQIEGARVTALCDLEKDRVSASQKVVTDAGFDVANEYVGENSWKQLCEDPSVDLVYICTDWATHTAMAVYAMEHGKHVAIEVPAAMSINECWQLVDTSEKTRKHCMMLENCVYDFFEMSALNMAQHGLFGEVYYAEGGYIHNLDPFWKAYHNNWRLAYDQKFRGDVYPTHGIGPLCQVMNIHRGDRFDYVVSMDTKSLHGAKVGKELMDSTSFANGEHTVSLLRTVNGKQICIQHNVYAARPYSRLYQLTGTEGFANKYPQPALAIAGKKVSDDVENTDYDKLDAESFLPQDAYEAMMEKYKPEFVKEIEEKAREVGAHGGMDYIMDYRLIYCMRNGLPLDQDVYDAAEWSCLTELSRLSLENNSATVLVPDFTRGDWNKVNGFSYAMKK